MHLLLCHVKTLRLMYGVRGMTRMGFGCGVEYGVDGRSMFPPPTFGLGDSSLLQKHNDIDLLDAVKRCVDDANHCC